MILPSSRVARRSCLIIGASTIEQAYPTPKHFSVAESEDEQSDLETDSMLRMQSSWN